MKTPKADVEASTTAKPAVGHGTPYSRPGDMVAATDKYWAELEQSSIAFSTPTTMDEDATSDVLLWLDPKATLSSLEDELRASVGQGQRIEGATGVKWAPRTRATLSSPGFDITPQQTIEYALSAEKRTEWTWQIHPKDSGTQTLHLAIEAILESEGKDSYRSIKTFDRDIDVKVSPSTFVKDNWQWLIATLVLPFVIWTWKRRHPPPPKP